MSESHSQILWSIYHGVVLDDWQQDLIAEGEVKGEVKGEIKGEVKGVIETARELGASDEFIITRLMNKQHMSRAGAETALKRYDESEYQKAQVSPQSE